MERGPFARAGVRVEELQAGVSDAERVAFPLLVVLDEQQVTPQVILGGEVGGLLQPLGELADAAEVGLVSPFTEAGQLHVVEHLLGKRREGDAFALGGRPIERFETEGHSAVPGDASRRELRQLVVYGVRSESSYRRGPLGQQVELAPNH